MLRRAFLIPILALLAVTASAQTTQNLPTTLVSYTPYPTYANLFADDIPATVNGQSFYVSFTSHTDSTGNCVSSCNVQFWNLETGEQTNVPYTGTLSGLTAAGTFNQPPFVGSFSLTLVQKLGCGGRYGCHKYYVQQGSTLTLD